MGGCSARSLGLSRDRLFISLRDRLLLRFLEFRVLIDDSVSLAFKLLWIPSLVVVQSAECSWVFLFHSIFVEYA